MTGSIKSSNTGAAAAAGQSSVQIGVRAPEHLRTSGLLGARACVRVRRLGMLREPLPGWFLPAPPLTFPNTATRVDAPELG